MAVGLLSGMSLTAYAAEKSETISLIGSQDSEVTSVTSEHFKVSAGYGNINDVGLTVNKFGAMTIESLNGENITKIELSYAWNSNAHTVSVTPGTLNDAYNTISDINATNVTVNSSSAAGVRFNSVKIYYSSTDVDVTGVTLSPNTTQTITVGENVAFTATVSPDNATSKTVTWTTSSEDIVSVDQSGKVTAMGVGTATITVTATNGTTATSDDKTATCTVTVVKNPTITFNANDGSGSMNAQTISYDVATTLTANAFTRTGCTFNGWNTSSDGTGTGYADGASIKLTADTTLYAQWTAISYTISYDLDGGTNNTANPTSYTVTSPDITLQASTKTGYTFAKWTSGNTEITSIPQGSTGNRTLKANWTANTYTIKFNGNGGTGSMSDLTLTYDVEGKLTDNKFTRAGYTFNGWKDNDGNKTYNGGASVKNLTATNGATITLYAQWKENEKTSDPEEPKQEEQSQEQETTDPKTEDPAQEQKPAEPQQEITDPQSEDVEETPESKTVNAETVSTMSNEELKQTFENKTAITLTGSISNENLSAVIEKIASVTEVKTLDLSQLSNVTEVKLSENVKVESLTVSGSKTITKVEVQNNTSLQKIDLSGSKVETIDAKGCTALTEVVLTSCDELQKLDVSETPITKLDTSNCEKLSSINCYSCDISELNISGCKKLADLNCANNSLSRLDVSGFSLNSLECQHQRLRGLIRSRALNILDILFRRVTAFLASAENENDLSDVANVKNIQAFDDKGEKIDVEFNDETGEVIFSKEPAIIQYDYITGFKNISMDVTVETSESTAKTIGGSGSGCYLSRSFLILLLLGFSMMKLKIHKKTVM